MPNIDRALGDFGVGEGVGDDIVRRDVGKIKGTMRL
jgi:hypothetical protein